MNNTKQRILSGAQQMFSTQSYHGTALDTLLGQVNVSKGSFFHYFKSKDDFLFELIEFESKNLFQKLEGLFQSSSNPLSVIYKFLDWRLNSYQSNGKLIAKLGAEVGASNLLLQRRIKKIYGDYLSYLIKIIETAKSNKQLIPSTPTKQLANFILYGLEGGTMSVTLTDSKDQYRSIVEMIKRTIRSYRDIQE